jgi:hypothetical protein
MCDVEFRLEDPHSTKSVAQAVLCTGEQWETQQEKFI